MTIKEIQKELDCGDVFTLEDFMDCVHEGGFIPSDGCGVFVFKEDKEIPNPYSWDNIDRSVWDVLEPIKEKAEDEEDGDIIGFKIENGKAVLKYDDYKTIDYSLPKELEDKIECVVWYNK